MDITVVLCTFNRAQSLVNSLRGVAASTLPDGVDWEVLVVDNNSTDTTREVVEDFSRTHPNRFRYLFEPQQGLSHARNRGVREAKGEIVAFLDDDVTVEQAWLHNLTCALKSGDWAGSGGPIRPDRNFAPPRWLSLNTPYALAPLALFDPKLPAGQIHEPPFGANMAFRKEMFRKYGGFRTDLGRCGNSLIGNEDTEFGRRLLAGGERLRYEPSAIVYHPVSESRVTERYFLQWWAAKARADIREFGVPPGTKWLLAGVPLYLIRRLVRWTLTWAISLRPTSRFNAKLKVWQVVGSILECYRVSRQPTPGKECNAQE